MCLCRICINVVLNIKAEDVFIQMWNKRLQNTTLNLLRDELTGGLLKTGWRPDLREGQGPRGLWNYPLVTRVATAQNKCLRLMIGFPISPIDGSITVIATDCALLGQPLRGLTACICGRWLWQDPHWFYCQMSRMTSSKFKHLYLNLIVIQDVQRRIQRLNSTLHDTCRTAPSRYMGMACLSSTPYHVITVFLYQHT